jgi:hypothetical protein
MYKRILSNKYKYNDLFENHGPSPSPFGRHDEFEKEVETTFIFTDRYVV